MHIAAGTDAHSTAGAHCTERLSRAIYRPAAAEREGVAACVCWVAKCPWRILGSQGLSGHRGRAWTRFGSNARGDAGDTRSVNPALTIARCVVACLEVSEVVAVAWRIGADDQMRRPHRQGVTGQGGGCL